MRVAKDRRLKRKARLKRRLQAELEGDELLGRVWLLLARRRFLQLLRQRYADVQR